VAQLIGGAGLVAETLDELRVFAQIPGQELERHPNPEQDILRQVNYAHAALA